VVGLCSVIFDVAVGFWSTGFDDDAAAAAAGLGSVLLFVATAVDEGLPLGAKLDRAVLAAPAGFFTADADTPVGPFVEDAGGTVELDLGEVVTRVGGRTFSRSSAVDVVLPSSFD